MEVSVDLVVKVLDLGRVLKRKEYESSIQRVR